MKKLIYISFLILFFGCDDGSCPKSLLLGNTGSCSQDATAVEMNLGNKTSEDDDPSLIYAQDGYFYLVFLSDRSGNKDLWISRSRDGISWSAPNQITTNTDDDVFPTLLQSSNGIFRLLWSRFGNLSGQSHMYYKTSPDGLDWTSSEVEVLSGVTDDQDARLLQISTHVLWIYFSSAERSNDGIKTSYNRDLYRVISTNAGQTWGTPKLLDNSSESESDRFPAVIQKGSNEFLMLFQRHDTDSFVDPTSDIFLSTSTDGLDWSTPIQLTSNNSGTQPSVFPSFFYASRLNEWVKTWTSTEFSADGGLVVQTSESSIDLTSQIGVGGWSARVAFDSDQKSLMVFVSSETGKPRLWSVKAWL